MASDLAADGTAWMWPRQNGQHGARGSQGAFQGHGSRLTRPRPETGKASLALFPIEQHCHSVGPDSRTADKDTKNVKGLAAIFNSPEALWFLHVHVPSCQCK